MSVRLIRCAPIGAPLNKTRLNKKAQTRAFVQEEPNDYHFHQMVSMSVRLYSHQMTLFETCKNVYLATFTTYCSRSLNVDMFLTFLMELKRRSRICAFTFASNFSI